MNSKPGWYPAPEGGKLARYHDGQQWTQRTGQLRPESPWVWVMAGALCAIGGAAIVGIFLSEESGIGVVAVLLGYLIAGAGWVLLMVGVIAAGVRLGSAHARADERDHS